MAWLIRALIMTKCRWLSLISFGQNGVAAITITDKNKNQVFIPTLQT